MKTRWWHLLRTQSTEVARGRVVELTDDELKAAIVNARADLDRFETCVAQLQLFVGAIKVEEALRR